MHVLSLLPAYALGILDEEESVEVSQHVASCPACRAEFQCYLAVVDQLALAAPDAAPPARLKQRLVQRVELLRPAPAQLPPPARLPWRAPLPCGVPLLRWRRPEGVRAVQGWRHLSALFRRAAPVWGLASLALIVALATSTIWLWQRANPRVHSVAGMQVVALVPTDAARGASGTLVISGDGDYGALVVDGLPPLDAAYQYQVWLIRDGQHTSGGVFSVNPHGYAAIEVMAPEPLASYPAFGITIEPAGGSPGPTGDKVLGGHL